MILAKLLQDDGTLAEYNPNDASIGLYLLFYRSGQLTVVADENFFHPHHENLFYQLPDSFQYDYVLGGGRYSKNDSKLYSHTKKWEIGYNSHDFGDIRDERLQKAIAELITGGEQDEYLPE